MATPPPGPPPYSPQWTAPPPSPPQVSERARPDGRKSSAIVGFVIAAVVFITAFGLGHNGGIGSSSSSVSQDPAAVVSNDDENNSGINAGPISDSVSPAVVNINTTVAGGGEAAGTGMVLTSDGVVLTNNHVIEGATDIQVEIGGDGTMRSARVLGYNVTDDVAVIKIRNVSNLATVKIGDSSRVSVSDKVVAIGNALGRGGSPTVSSGTVAAINQTITAGDANGGNTETLRNMIQINAEIQPGDSGGPLVNLEGEVIGMNTAAASGGFFRQSASNIAFAIPINNAREIAEAITAGRESATIHIGERGILGVSIQSEAAQSGPFGRPNSGSGTSGAGARVIAVEGGSPAADAGIEDGSTITGINDTTVRSAADLNAAMSPFHPDDKVKVSWTDASGQKHTETITLMLGPPA